MNIPVDILAFNEGQQTLEAKSLGFCLRSFMTLLMPVILHCSSCVLKIYMSESTLYLSFAGDGAFVTKIPETFYGLLNNKPMNEKTKSLAIEPEASSGGGGCGGCSGEDLELTDLCLPKVHIFGCFKDAALTSLNVSKATALFMDYCGVFLALACPPKTINFCVELQHKVFSFTLSPWTGQRRYKCDIGDERYGTVCARESSSNYGNFEFTDLLAVKHVKFTPGFSVLVTNIEGPSELFEICLVSRASSPLFLAQYYYDIESSVFLKASSPGPLASGAAAGHKFDDSIFVRALGLVSNLCQKHFGIIIRPGIYYSRTSELFELGLSDGRQVLGLNTFSKDLKDAPDVELFLVNMIADFLDRAMNLGSALVRYVCLRQPPNMEMCVECMDRGSLVCCDVCPRSYCFRCLGISEAPSDEKWECPKHKPLELKPLELIADGPPKFDGQQKVKGLKRPRPLSSGGGASGGGASGGYSEHSFSGLIGSDGNLDLEFDFAASGGDTDAYLKRMMPGAYADECYGAAPDSVAAGGGAYGGSHGGGSYGGMAYSGGAYSGGASGYDYSDGLLRVSDAAKKHRPKTEKKPRKDQDNLLKQAFDIVLESSPAVEVPTHYPALPMAFFGMSADETYKHFPIGMPYVRETVKQAILNKKFKIAKPGGGAGAGGNVREIGPKISWLRRDLEICGLLGFCAHDVYELYLQSDQQALEREAMSSRGVCFVFRK